MQEETLLKTLAIEIVEAGKERVVGIEINANHLRGKRDGTLAVVAADAG